MIAATAALAACVAGIAGSGTAGGVSTSADSGRTTGLRSVDEAVQRPNVLMLTLDDLSERDLAVMPHTRELIADQGTTLTQGLAPTPICAPARASLLTGQYAHNHGVLTIEGRGGGIKAFKDRRTLPVWMRAAGYDTMFAGKYINGYGQQTPAYVPPGWNHWRGSVDPSTYRFFGTKFDIDGRMVTPPGYSTDILSRYTTELLGQHRRGQLKHHPWFMWVNYVAPHHGGARETDDPPGSWPGGRRLLTTMPAPRDRNKFSTARLPNCRRCGRRTCAATRSRADRCRRPTRRGCARRTNSGWSRSRPWTVPSNAPSAS